ncbi:MAG: tetratricopeptide repeat protein [Magnetovibrio sp.]|nr:tetratricopeptide repeat protein [Magnetovibrio sp.]
MPSSEMQALLAKGLTQYQSGHLEQAYSVYMSVLNQEAHHVDALNMAGICAWQCGDLSRALDLLDQAIVNHPGHPQAYLNLGVILEHSGHYEDAVNAYRASLEAEPGQTLAMINLGNALSQLMRFEEAIEIFDNVIESDPSNIEVRNNKALALKDSGQMEDAEACLKSALTVDSNAEQTWTNLGLVLRLQGKIEEAFAAYDKALEVNPTSLKILNNLAVLHRWEGNLNEAEAICRGVLSVHPEVVEVLNNLGDILQAQGRIDDARGCFEEVLRIEPNHPEGHHNLAVIMLLCGDFKNGWHHYEWRWLAKEFPSERRNFPQPLWTGGELDGQTVLLYVEQGLGDALQFVRYAPMVQKRGGKVIVECPRSLQRLFETVDGIDQVISRGDSLPHFDVQCPFLSLPGIFSPGEKTIPKTIPYLHVTDPNRGIWAVRLQQDDEIKVGLVWAGSPHHTNDRERSIPLTMYAPLFKVQGCSFYNLQIGESAGQLAGVSGPIIDLTNEIDDYADTAALVDQLDVVITVDTSVAHVAGALGKDVWVLLPFAPDWRWQLERKDSPWYPTMKLYRQPQRRDWDSVIQTLVDDLEGLSASTAKL